MRKLGPIFIVFMSGLVAGTNMACLLPNPDYVYSWGKVAFAASIAVAAAIWNVTEEK